MAADSKSSGANLSNALTDLMTSLMVIFVLLLVATLNNASAEGENTRNLILIQLQKELDVFKEQGVRVEKDPNDPLGLLVLVPEGLLNFALDKSIIPRDGTEFLRNFAPKLAMTACSDRFKGDISSIVVEGHTDSSGTDEHNLKLSQERSLAVVQQTLAVLDQQDSVTKGCFLDFLSANGRGSRERILDTAGKEDRDKSRRVIFKIRVRSFEQREFKALLGK
jgi:outer membrane protein OmpA-like peptidoglycan-associated protein